MHDDLNRIGELRDRLEQGIVQRIPDCAVTGDPSRRLSNTSNIVFNRAEGESILAQLDRVLDVLPGIVERARAVSLFGKDRAPTLERINS